MVPPGRRSSVISKLIMALPTNVYYGLTKEEAKRSKLIYPSHPKYDGKGVNTSLDGLKRFLADYEMDKITHYVKLQLSEFKVLQHIYPDPKYDMLTISTPFSIDLRKYQPKRIN